MPGKYKTYFRISYVSEKIEDDVDVILVSAEIIPQYTEGIPTSTKNWEKELEALYKEKADYLVELTGKVIKNLAIEVWVLSGYPKRAEKLQGLKMKLIRNNFGYSDEHFMYEIEYGFKPFMKPVFGKNFAHRGFIYKEELKTDSEK